MNTKLHAVTAANVRPISLFVAAGQLSDYTAVATLLGSLPEPSGYWVIGAMTQIGSGMP